MARLITTARKPARALGSTVAIATASLFIALAAALGFAFDGSDDVRGLHLRGSLAASDPGAPTVPLPAPAKHV